MDISDHTLFKFKYMILIKLINFFNLTQNLFQIRSYFQKLSHFDKRLINPFKGLFQLRYKDSENSNSGLFSFERFLL